MHKIGIVMAVLLASAGARADKVLDGGQVHQGVVVEAQLGTDLVSFTTFNGGIGGGASTYTFNGMKGGIFGGYKLGRVIFGLGFDLARFATGASATGGASSSTATTIFTFVPGASVAIVRSADKRVELFGELDLGFGTTVVDRQSDTDYFHFSYAIGPGVRYWIHPQFAFSALAGLDGQFEYDSVHNAGTTQSSSTGITSIFSQLQLMGVF